MSFSPVRDTTGVDPSNFEEFPRQYVHHLYFSNFIRNIVFQTL